MPIPQEPLEPGVKQMLYSWTRYHGQRRVILATGESMYSASSESIEDTLKELIMRMGWTFISRNTYFSSDNYGDGYLRYRE